jgi:hypothetical protein
LASSLSRVNESCEQKRGGAGKLHGQVLDDVPRALKRWTGEEKEYRYLFLRQCVGAKAGLQTLQRAISLPTFPATSIRP